MLYENKNGRQIYLYIQIESRSVGVLRVSGVSESQTMNCTFGLFCIVLFWVLVFICNYTCSLVFYPMRWKGLHDLSSQIIFHLNTSPTNKHAFTKNNNYRMHKKFWKKKTSLITSWIGLLLHLCIHKPNSFKNWLI